MENFIFCAVCLVFKPQKMGHCLCEKFMNKGEKYALIPLEISAMGFLLRFSLTEL